MKINTVSSLLHSLIVTYLEELRDGYRPDEDLSPETIDEDRIVYEVIGKTIDVVKSDFGQEILSC